jgi:hypothetical protein
MWWSGDGTWAVACGSDEKARRRRCTGGDARGGTRWRSGSVIGDEEASEADERGPWADKEEADSADRRDSKASVEPTAKNHCVGRITDVLLTRFDRV